MSAFRRLLKEGIKAENCLARFRVLKRHSTSTSSPSAHQEKRTPIIESALAHQKKRTPIIESALEREADKFHGDIGRKNEELLSDLKDGVANFIATFDKVDRQLAESFPASCKAARRSMVYLGIAIGVYLGALFEVLVSIKRSAEEVDGPSPQQV
ncbi:uncharacterized protein J3R85_015961 [Psidium guajava]|nr:uncharacterized protein J3R85_015961 [Psidium guajava]